MRSLPLGPVVKTVYFHCRGHGLDPGQGPKIPHAELHGKKKKNKEYIYIYIYKKLNHFVVQQKLTQHCKSTILQ